MANLRYTVEKKSHVQLAEEKSMVQNIGRKKKHKKNPVLVHLFLVQLSQELHGGLPTLLRSPGSPGCQDAWDETHIGSLGWLKTKYPS